jgi:hypothetical protein
MIFRRMDGVKENKLVPDIRRADPRFMKGFNHAAGNDRGSALLLGGEIYCPVREFAASQKRKLLSLIFR